MKIDRKLNLVIPIERDDGPLYIFSMPVDRLVFERYFLVISKTFSRVYQENLGFLGGPRVCALMLKEVAQNTPRSDRSGSLWDGPDGVENGLVAEIRRLTNVLAPTDGGWRQIPYEDALKRDMLTEDEVSEVEGAITFFIVNWCMHKKAVAEAILQSAAGMWGLEVTSSSITEYRSSLTISTPPEPSGEKEALSSIPS